MAETRSTMIELGTKAPAFALPNTNRAGGGERVSLDDLREAPALLVSFICNHCPYVRHIADGLASFAAEYQQRGLALVAISPNDVTAYPDDSPERMSDFAAHHHFTFPYLYDESQQVARAYEAACTPDFFLFDGDRRLVYRGQFDDSRPGKPVPVTGADLRAAADAVLAGRTPPADRQKPSVGCSIKWKPGNEPD